MEPIFVQKNTTKSNQMKKTHGNGKYTGIKEGVFSTCIGFSLANQRAKFFWLFDLNAGPGINRDNGQNIGSSSTNALKKFRQRDQHGAIYACEIKNGLAAQLRQNLEPTQPYLFPELEPISWEPGRSGNIHVRVFNEDNEELIKKIPTLIREKEGDPKLAQGAIVADPNGLAIPVIQLGDLLQQCPKLDLLVHFSSLERLNGFRQNHPDHPMAQAVNSIKSIDEILYLKRYSQIAKLGGQHYVCFLSSIPLETYKQGGLPTLYSTRSSEGREIINDLRRSEAGD